MLPYVTLATLPEDLNVLYDLPTTYSSGRLYWLALRLLHLQVDGSIHDLYVRSPMWRCL
jgi:hypothetical protein